MRIKRFQDLECWQVARGFLKTIYTLTNNDAFKKDFALKDQIRRASISIMANIAEGFSRNSDKEFLRFLDISRGSLSETLSHLYVSLDQNYINENEFNTLSSQVEEIGKKINALIRYLHQTIKSSRPNKSIKTNQTN